MPPREHYIVSSDDDEDGDYQPSDPEVALLDLLHDGYELYEEDYDEDDIDDEDEEDDDDLMVDENGYIIRDDGIGYDDDQEMSDDTESRAFADLLEFAQAVDDGESPLAFLSGRVSGSFPSILHRLAMRSDSRFRNNDWASKVKKKQTVANPKGTELLRSGEFGRVGNWQAPGKAGRQRSRGWQRAVKGWKPPRSTTSQHLVPNEPGTVVAYYPSVPYVGQFAGEDYSIFYTATQYFTLHLYSTTQYLKSKNNIHQRRTVRLSDSIRPTLTLSTPPARGNRVIEDEDQDGDEDDWEDEDDYVSGSSAIEDSSMKRIKRVQGVEGRWTITDCDADKKGEKMIYSSITPYVHMLYTDEFDQEHVELDFSHPRERGNYYRSGIWSIRFSADGKEIVAGASDGKIMVYDINAQRRSLSVSGHAEDVNAVCFADHSSTNVLISGSDDGYIKVWDRRSLSSHVPSGVLVGATEGITYTSPKGDGRYIVANSKDQAARLYDLRKMRSYGDFVDEPNASQKYGAAGFDYRDMRYPRSEPRSHPQDCSVMTYSGHSVLRTLIRCHFSPIESTGQSYIYSGSADGMIHVWSLDGRVIQVLDRSASEGLYSSQGIYSDPSAAPRSPQSSRTNLFGSYSHAVRDVAWHGYEPTLMSTCWDMMGSMRRGGTIAKHEWKGLGKNGLAKLEDWEMKRKEENEGSRATS
ncbi:WD-repeat protein 23 [Cryptococcus neoformans]|nr:WD repeat-containing protein 23 [Cryptococcus neoformans var. grubii Th84]OXH18759.1 WD-repeat protein 23 [Cryptococcus neoformans var. grubii]OXH38244.1 WD repeat-containing protein 23 [Cryptococcus neoformans var. grubii]OXH58945.1 WD repeat-containing protein 23 [Cryptococcus neoformans var. grubii]OXH59769.1 WD repeat-containing protein 23 [Cryptococcus neoformans var. grubii]